MTTLIGCIAVTLAAFGIFACAERKEIAPGTYVAHATGEEVVILQTKAHEKAVLDLKLRGGETAGQKAPYRGRFNYWLQPDQTFHFYNGSSSSAANLGRYKWRGEENRLIRRSLWPQDSQEEVVFVLQ